MEPTKNLHDLLYQLYEDGDAELLPESAQAAARAAFGVSYSHAVRVTGRDIEDGLYLIETEEWDCHKQLPRFIKGFAEVPSYLREMSDAYERGFKNGQRDKIHEIVAVLQIPTQESMNYRLDRLEDNFERQLQWLEQRINPQFG